MLLVVVAIAQLWFEGQGLPMNAYPPKVLVKSGAYFFFRHPIYVGFCIGCFGISLFFHSAAGFYLVSPIVVLLCWALIKGYEEPDMHRRFTNQLLQVDDGDQHASIVEKIRAIVPVFIVWLAGYELFVFIGFDNTYVNTVTRIDSWIPINEWAEIPYFCTYLFVFLSPWFMRTRKQLRDFRSVAGWVVVLGLFLMGILPMYAAPKEFEPHSWLGRLIIWERQADSSAAAFPSFHVLWSLITARVLTMVFPRQKILWWVFTLIIAWSCLATGAHSVVDVIAAFLFFGLVVNRLAIWNVFQRVCERIANSWTEYRIGGFRVISHAVYSGLAALVGTFIVGQFFLAFDQILIIVLGSCIGGMVWGQWIEGSPRLLRPFGFFGALIGGAISTLMIAVIYGEAMMPMFAAIALAAPWTQAIGRLRCLVQGCCHGRKVNEAYAGIIYTNPHSRVCAISGLRGVPLHNTQGYSILLNVIIGLVLIRIWYGGATDALIAGLYFMLTGISRFVEEAYRGEVQTKKIGGLALYQWLSIFTIIVGATVTSLPGSSSLSFQPNVSQGLLTASFVAGLIWAFGMSMDFPKSNIPFSRLSG